MIMLRRFIILENKLVTGFWLLVRIPRIKNPASLLPLSAILHLATQFSKHSKVWQ